MIQPSPFHIRGVVEGFYGVFYTFPERNDLIRFIGRHGYNLYIYGPKNDRQHRARWWEPYPPEVMAQFAETVAVARAAGVTFCYAISPISYATDADFARLTGKLRSFYDLGVRSFSVFMDDITPPLDPDQNDKGYVSHAKLHVDICNRLLAWLEALDEACTLSMCPTDYYGTPPFSNYLRALGEHLHPAIGVFYTGPQVCAPTITAADVTEFARVIRRQPIIWDNYPVNDLAMRAELHLGPVQGRAAALPGAARGLVVNPMIQPEASKVALLTFADYFNDPVGYEPAASWELALMEVAGRAGFEALRHFAELARQSCLEPVEAPMLSALTEATIVALRNGRSYAGSDLVRALESSVNQLDEACYTLKNRMDNLALRKDLLPWIEALEDWIWLGKRSLLAIEAYGRGDPAVPRRRQELEWSLQEIARHNKRSGGRALLPLAEYALELTAEPAYVHIAQ